MKKLMTFAVLGALTLALSGCTNSAIPNQATDTDGVCAGVRVVVDFASLDETTIDKCVETDESLTALEAFKDAGLTVTGSDEAGENWICRIDDRPGANEQLSTDTQGPYTEDCAAYGPGWAFWALYVDTGSGWTAANEGVATQQVKPGQAVGAVWQLSDNAADMDAWQKPSV